MLITFDRKLLSGFFIFVDFLILIFSSLTSHYIYFLNLKMTKSKNIFQFNSNNGKCKTNEHLHD